MNQAYFSLNTNSFIQIRYMQPRTHATRTYATRTYATPENYRSSKKIDLPIYPDKTFSLLSLKISDAGKE